MKYLLIFLGICCLMACSSSKNENNKLPVLDISKEYPIQRMDIHEIADVEYIPLETTDSSLLFRAVRYCISNEYIVTESSGTILFFDRKTGKYQWRFNRHGQGEEEYNSSYFFVVDFVTKECFVYDLFRKKFFVYTLYGDFIRSFSVKGIIEEFDLNSIYDYDKDYMIGFNYYSSMNLAMKDTHPYYLINKQDGTVVPLNINITDRISSCLHREKIMTDDGKMAFTSSELILEMISLLKNGNETLIADFAIDTLYSFKDRKLIPLAIQTPTVRQGNVPLIIAPAIYTDTYLSFYVMKYEYNSSDPQKPIKEAPYLFWNRKTGEISRFDLYDSNILVDRYCDPNSYSQNMLPNNTIGFLRAEFLVEQYEINKLSGKLKEVAKNLKEDDNWVVVLYKFK